MASFDSQTSQFCTAEAKQFTLVHVWSFAGQQFQAKPHLKVMNKRSHTHTPMTIIMMHCEFTQWPGKVTHGNHVFTNMQMEAKQRGDFSWSLLNKLKAGLYLPKLFSWWKMTSALLLCSGNTLKCIITCRMAFANGARRHVVSFLNWNCF